jgi:hypothetical protein
MECDHLDYHVIGSRENFDPRRTRGLILGGISRLIQVKASHQGLEEKQAIEKRALHLQFLKIK